MTDLTRRGLFGLKTGALASTAIPALMWRQSPLNKDRIVNAIIAKLDGPYGRSGMDYTPQEKETHKKRGGWPEYRYDNK